MKHILIVDDSSVFRLMIIGVLKKELKDTVSFTQANDGIEAITLLKEQRFHLIMTDLNMPNMGGLELVTNIRNNKDNKFVKVCVLSGEADKEFETEAKTAGANAFIIKPFDPPKLLSTVKKLLI